MLASIGIDFTLIVVQILNFVILVWILQKFLYRPILEKISARQKENENVLVLKKQLETQQAKIAEERKQIFQEAEEEAHLLLERKKEEAEKLKRRILTGARTEKEEIIAQGRKEIAAKKSEQQQALQHEVLELATLMTEKVLTNLLSHKDQQEIIQKELNKLVQLHFSPTSDKVQK